MSDELPRLPFQLWECVLRTAYFITQVPSLIRGRSLRPVGGVGRTPCSYRGWKRGRSGLGSGTTGVDPPEPFFLCGFSAVGAR
jgi:hypothetical protein